MDKGWVKLSRNITDNWIWQNHEYAYAFIDLLLMVNHEDKKILINGSLTTIKKGQCWTSVRKLSKKWGWSRNKVEHFLVTLQQDEMVTHSGTPYGTLLTIENWAKYQVRETPKKTPEGQPKVTPKGEQKVKQKVNKQEYIKNEKEIKKENLPSESNQQEDDGSFWEKFMNDEVDIEIDWSEVDMTDV